MGRWHRQVLYSGAGNDRDIILQHIGGVVPTNVKGDSLPDGALG